MLLPGDPDALVPLSDGYVGLVQAVAGVFKLEAVEAFRGNIAA